MILTECWVGPTLRLVENLTHCLNSKYMKQIYLLVLKTSWHIAMIKDFTGKDMKLGSER